MTVAFEVKSMEVKNTEGLFHSVHL